MRAWYQDYGFSSNPFSIKPAVFSDEVIGYELKDVFEKIDSGNVLFIKGKYGFGKTTILRHLIRRFGGKKQVMYHSTSRGKLNVESMLLKRTLINRLFKNKPYDMILLVDEAQDISKDETEEINRFYNEGNIKSAVFLGTAYKKSVFTKEFNQALKDNTVVLGGLSEQHAIDLIRKRIGNIRLLSDEIILQIYKKSNLNPRKFLELCEDICKVAFETGSEAVNEDVLRRFFPETARKETRKKAVAKTTKGKKGEKKKAVKGKKPAKKEKAKKKKQEKIVVQEIDSKKMQPPIIKTEYNLDNVRTYEEEMSTIKEEKPHTEEK